MIANMVSTGLGWSHHISEGDAMTEDEYKAAFSDLPHEGTVNEADTRAGRALMAALDIRKFEIDLYWKRATYFWAFIAAAFAGYGLTYRTAVNGEPWLSFVFSALGLVFSFAWYLVNRGSKFWQNNWERHVDLLEDMTLGPLYKIIAVTTSERNPLTASGAFSVTKINQMLSLFVTVVWVAIFSKALSLESVNYIFDGFDWAVLILTVAALFLLWKLGRSKYDRRATSKLVSRAFDIKP
jgi:hypothetical protein